MPQLTNGANFDIGTSSVFPVLWIDGATVDLEVPEHWFLTVRSESAAEL